MSPSPNFEDLLTIREAAKLGAYGSESTIRRRIKTGALPSMRNGKLTYVRRADLDALIKPVTYREHAFILSLARELAAAAPDLSEERKAQVASLLR